MDSIFAGHRGGLQVGDRHLKFHEFRDNLSPCPEQATPQETRAVLAAWAAAGT